MGLLNKFRQEGKKLDLTQEVVQNVVSLLNSKQSFSAWQKGFGLKHYSSNNTNQTAVQEIISDITYNIVQYEKRMKLISIDPQESDNSLTLRLKVTCEIGGQFHSFYIGFNNFQNQVKVESEPASRD